MNILLMTSAAPEYAPLSTAEKRPPLGVGYLMSALRAAGHRVHFIDNYLKPSGVLETDFLTRNDIDWVGIYANTICFQDTLAMLRQLQAMRERGEWSGKVMVGGPHTSVTPETIPEFVDYVVIGEGEISAPGIVAGEVQDRVVKGERVADLDSLPFPAWEDFIDKPYSWAFPEWVAATPVYTFNTSRGCPFECRFCSVNAVWGRSYRYMSAARVLDDIDRMVTDYGMRVAYFREDHFTLNKQRTVQFCEGLLQRGDGIEWMCETRVDNMDDPDYIELLARSGCRALYIGVESGSPRLLEFMKKGETVDQFRDAFELARKNGIKTYASLIAGIPTETEDDLRMTFDFIEAAEPDFCGWNVYIGLPGSDLYRYARENDLYEFEDENGILYLKGHDARIDRFCGGNPYYKVPYPNRIKWRRLKKRVTDGIGWRLAGLKRRLSGPPVVRRSESDDLAGVFDERYAADYRDEATGYEAAREKAIEHFVQSSLRSQSVTRMLDYGAGGGLHVKLWERIFPGAEKHFCDISSVALGKLAAKYPQYAEYCHHIGRGARPNLKPFDVVVSVEVMEHVENLTGYLEDVRELLSPGGHFIWTTPCANALSVEHVYAKLAKRMLPTREGYRVWDWEDATHRRRLKSREVIRLLEEHGFGSVRLRYRAHFFSFVCGVLPERQTPLLEKLTCLDYALFRCLPNGASMLGSARRNDTGINE